MGHGIDVCLASPERAATGEERLESELVRCLVCQAGLVMAGEKPAAVFGFRARCSNCPAPTLSTLLSLYALRLRPEGVRLVSLGTCGGARMLLVWRPRMVRDLLAAARNRAFLSASSLPSAEPDALMEAIASRLRAYYAGSVPFPHEIGLVLGYPLEDVEGFIADGGRGAVACGRWKVYGDPVRARERFERLGRAEHRVRRLYSEGVPVRELLRMAVA